MIDNAGYLYPEKRDKGREDLRVPIAINCCGSKRFFTRDYLRRRPDGRLDYQLLYVYCGTGHYLFSDGWKAMEAGSLILYRPGEPQGYCYYAEETPEIYWIHFTGSEVESELAHYQIRTGMIGKSPELRNFFDEIISELQLKNLHFSDFINCDFKRLLVLIARTRNHYLCPSHNNFSVNRLILHLNRTYMEPWTIRSMADFCNISPDYLAHLFKDNTNVSPMRYLNQIRVEKAEELLSVTDLQIQEIATLVGYPDSLYFSRTFKKLIGEAPLAYRKQHRERNSTDFSAQKLPDRVQEPSLS